MLVPDESCAGPRSTSSLSCWEYWVSSGVTSDGVSALRLSAWLDQPSGLNSSPVSPVPEWSGHSQSSKRNQGCSLMAAHSWRRGKDSLSSELELSGYHSSVTSHSTSQEDTSTGVRNTACWREQERMLVTPFHQQEGRALGCSSSSADLLARIHLGIVVLQKCPSVNAVIGGGSVSLSLNSQSLLCSCLLFTGV